MNISKRLNTYLKNHHINLTIIDVGARGEIQPIWKPLKSNLKVIGFEPDKEEYENLKLNNKSNTYFNVAL